MRLQTKPTKAFIYARISTDEKDKRHSIDNQIEIIKEYAKNNNFEIVNVFIDEGYSGQTLKRPAFTNMLEQLKSGVAKTIIVKDLSRLARNYIEMGKLMENTFPRYNIRFIAINDNVDSSKPIDDFVIIKNFMNEYYVRDLSRKTKRYYLRKSQTQKLTHSKKCVYGFKYNKEDDGVLVDETTSKIVKYIFEEYINGKSMGAIAKELKSQKVYIPGYYRYLTTGSKAGLSNIKNIEECKYEWTHSMVSIILHRIEYTGVAVNYRFSNLKKKKIPREENDWIYIENVYPQIISKDIFEQAKNIQSKNPCFTTSDTPHLTKILFNSDEKALLFNTTDLKKPVYYTRDKKYYVDANELHEAITADINLLLKQLIEDEKQLIQILKQSNQDDSYINIEKIKEEKEVIGVKIGILFEQHLSEQISEEEFTNSTSMYNSRIKEIDDILETNKSLEIKRLTLNYKINEFLKLLKSANKVSEMDLIYHLIDEIVVNFIDKKIYEIQILYKFIDN